MSNGHWVKVSNHISRNYKSVSAFDSLNCAAISMFENVVSRLELTSDGGYNWTQMFTDDDVFVDPENCGGPIKLTSVAYPSQELIICGGHDTWIIRSTDQGQTWTKNRIDSSGQDIIRLRMYDSRFGAAITKNNMYITTDGGLSWSLYDTNGIGSGSYFWDISFCPGADSMLIAFVGSQSYKKSCFIKTRDRGRTWELYKQSHYASAPIFFLDSLCGYTMFAGLTAEGSRDIIYRTTDGAKTWDKIFDSLILPAQAMMDIYFYNKNLGIYYGSYNKILITDDGGFTWRQEYLQGIYCYVFAGIILSETNMLVFTQEGDIYKYESKTGFKDEPDVETGQFNVYDNFADNQVSVLINKGDTEFDTDDISIYDVLGSIIPAESQLQLIRTGNETAILTWDYSEQDNGVYFIHIRHGNNSRIAKVIISR